MVEPVRLLFIWLLYFLSEHQNWFGNDENLGPVAISIKKEKIEHSDNTKNSNGTSSHYQFRIIIRTSEVCTF